MFLKYEERQDCNRINRIRSSHVYIYIKLKTPENARSQLVSKKSTLSSYKSLVESYILSYLTPLPYLCLINANPGFYFLLFAFTKVSQFYWWLFKITWDTVTFFPLSNILAFCHFSIISFAINMFNKYLF